MESNFGRVCNLAERQHGAIAVWQHVSVPRGGGGREREGIRIHRRGRMETGTIHGIPVTSPSPPRWGRLGEGQAIRGRTKSDAEARLVLEVDGWEYHKERPQFEEDRRRTLIHTAAGWQVVRASALQVFHEPELVLEALQTTGW